MTTADMLGRADELRIVTDLIDGLPGQGGAVVVLGEAGIGKTSLVRATARYGRVADAQVLETTGVEGEARMPFAGLHQLLRPLLPGTDLLPVAQRQALMIAFGMAEGARPDLFMIALAALNLITDAAVERPVVLVIDDTQWLDRPTQEVLAFVARRVGLDPILMIGTENFPPEYPAALGDCDTGTIEVESRGKFLGGAGSVDVEGSTDHDGFEAAFKAVSDKDVNFV